MYDHYAVARRLAAEVERQGLAEAARAIINIIDEGCSGTEIFMGLRFHLRPLASDLRLGSATRNEIDGLLAKLNDQLSN